MAYYVTIQDNAGHRTIYAAGPFNRHGDAECAVGWVRRHCAEAFPNDRELAWVGWGTAHVRRTRRMPKGRFNEAIGLPAGRIAESPLAPNRWWNPGEQPELPVKAPQRRPRRVAA